MGFRVWGLGFRVWGPLGGGSKFLAQGLTGLWDWAWGRARVSEAFAGACACMWVGEFRAHLGVQSSEGLLARAPSFFGFLVAPWGHAKDLLLLSESEGCVRGPRP